MKLLPLLALTAIHISAAPETPKTDWRHELLKEEGIDSSKEGLKNALSEIDQPTVGLEEAYKNLGADQFKKREEAQRTLLKGGQQALDWLQQLEPSKDPEVRKRVAEIKKLIRSPNSSGRDTAVQHALRSLLSGDKTSDTLLYEWFPRNTPAPGSKYRLFKIEGTKDRAGRIAEGRLLFDGDKNIDNDQRFRLQSGTWPGKEDFGKSFRVSAKMGGTEGGAAAWHIGITIGQVRVLYHPGYQGGGFRFEKLHSTPYLTQNVSMGFTPSTNHLQWMSVDVHQLPDGRVKLDATVQQGEAEGKQFHKSLTVDAATIGKLNQISFDRSGRTGGQAILEELSVNLRTP